MCCILWGTIPWQLYARPHCNPFALSRSMVSMPSNYKWCSAWGKMERTNGQADRRRDRQKDVLAGGRMGRRTAAALWPVNGNRNSCKWQLAQLTASLHPKCIYMIPYMYIGVYVCECICVCLDVGEKSIPLMPHAHSHQQKHEQLTLANCSGKYTKCGHNHVMLIPCKRRVYSDITRVCL